MLKFCKKCGCASERYADGRCKKCTLQRHAEWVSRNRDAVNLNSQAWNLRNGNKKREHNAAYRALKKDEINAKRKAQRASDPSIERIKAATRRARKKQNGGHLSKEIVQQLLEKQQGLCACCSVPLNGIFHLDHIMPLALGGKNTDDNVQLLLPRCNMQKHKLHPEEFLKRKRL